MMIKNLKPVPYHCSYFHIMYTKEKDIMYTANSKNEAIETYKQIAPAKKEAPTSTPAPIPKHTPAELSEFDYTGKKLVALTFDDGPNLDTTPLVLDILEEHGVVATFFLIGKDINEETKPVMERQLQLGCEIANHSFSHSYMDRMTAEEIKEEIEKTSNIIKEMVGITPKFFRPPYIVTSPTMFEVIDLPFINGINCMDWDASVSSEDRAKGILDNVKDGDIVLLHDFSGNINTVKALDTIIQGLLDDGYTLVTLSKLFELKGIDPNVKNKLWINTNL
ncbi:polysaccharide deacetylase family protein [Herbinix hemicellulosilytica]|nr:polysaccharide deacetylase family protein [Herbinix hemicellulosilytica]